MTNPIFQVNQVNLTAGSLISDASQTIVQDEFKLNDNQSAESDVKLKKWIKIKSASRNILPRASKGEIKLLNIIDELQKFAKEEKEIVQNEHTTVDSRCNSVRFIRQRLAKFFHTPLFHYTIIVLVIIDLLLVLVDLVLGQLSSPCLTDDEMTLYNITEQRDTCLLEHSINLTRADLFLFYFSVVLLFTFVLEIFLSLFVFGWRYFMNLLYLLDGIIVIASFIMEIYFHFGNIGRAGRAAAAIVILRLWKIIRAIHAVAHSITLKNRLLIQKIQEAKTILEEEKQKSDEILERQNIKIEYLMNKLNSTGKLPSKSQIDEYIEYEFGKRTVLT